MYLSSSALADGEPYKAGLTKEYVAAAFGVAMDDIAKLGSAENPYGPSPLALDAVHEKAKDIDIYPDWTAEALRNKIAEKYGFDPERIVCGSGETEIISCIIRAFAKPEDKILMFDPCFPLYFLTAEAEARVAVGVPMGDGFEFDIDEYIEKLKDPDVRVAFVTNPHSPSGKLMATSDIRRICEASREQNMVTVIDEAYIHFSKTEGAIHLAREFDHVIGLRTFSKAFGLAGLRAGFGVASPKIIQALLRIKPTWNMGQAQIAGACAALDDDAHVERTVNMIAEMRDYVTGQLRGLNAFRVVEGSQANFFMIEVVNDQLDSSIVFDGLLERGVIVKDCSVSFRGLGKRYLRVDVSLKKHMDRLVWALKDIDDC